MNSTTTQFYCTSPLNAICGWMRHGCGVFYGNDFTCTPVRCQMRTFESFQWIFYCSSFSGRMITPTVALYSILNLNAKCKLCRCVAIAHYFIYLYGLRCQHVPERSIAMKFDLNKCIGAGTGNGCAPIRCLVPEKIPKTRTPSVWSICCLLNRCRQRREPRACAIAIV